MFKLLSDIVAKMLNGKVDYNDVPFDKDNEVVKGYCFKDQARVNLKLEKKYKAICSAVKKGCIKDSCILYHSGKWGKIENGWVCREYQVDFPEASFDERDHLYLVGTNKIDFSASKKNLQELIEEGAKYFCLNCKKVYAKKPTQPYETGHGERMLEMCRCGSDLFDSVYKLMEILENIE